MGCPDWMTLWESLFCHPSAFSVSAKLHPWPQMSKLNERVLPSLSLVTGTSFVVCVELRSCMQRAGNVEETFRHV